MENNSSTPKQTVVHSPTSVSWRHHRIVFHEISDEDNLSMLQMMTLLVCVRRKSQIIDLHARHFISHVTQWINIDIFVYDFGRSDLCHAAQISTCLHCYCKHQHYQTDHNDERHRNDHIDHNDQKVRARHCEGHLPCNMNSNFNSPFCPFSFS